MAVGRADRIASELLHILEDTRAERGFPPVPAAKLDGAIVAVRSLVDRLADLQGHVVLAERSPDDDEMEAARRLWELVDADRDIGSPGALVSASPTLSALHRAALTIRSVHRFSPERVELAKLIGECAKDIPQYVSMLVPRVTDLYKTFSISNGSEKGMEEVLRALVRAGAASRFRLEGKLCPKARDPYWMDKNKLPRGLCPTMWRIRRGDLSPQWATFLKGDWLTAYAYGIAYDQFVRAGAPFEIYSKVQYRLPGDQGGGSSDIDVLVRTADLLVCIECKSGQVLARHNGEHSAAEKTLHAAERLDEVLDTMGVGLDRTYHLLYLPRPGEEPDAVRQTVQGGRVPVVVSTFADVRRIVLRAAGRQDVEFDQPA